MESISKYNLHGIEYVKLDELNALVRQMKKDAREGVKPGYICEDEKQRIAAFGALNHLDAVLNKEKNQARIHQRVEQARKEREAKEKVKEAAIKAREALDKAVDAIETPEEEPGSWMVYCPGKKRGEYWLFREWDDGDAVIGKNEGMVFTYKGMAEHVAEKLGAGWVVIDVSQEACERANKLLDALFRDDEPEYHGDGTKAEDEDWDEE